MPKKYNPPCIQGLKAFQKKGCPGQVFDEYTGEGCQAWKEYSTPGEPGKPPVVLKGCSLLLAEHWQFEALKMLEGNQQATEKLRNGLCQDGPNGQTHPKANPMALSLLAQALRPQEALLNVGNIKTIDGGQG